MTVLFLDGEIQMKKLLLILLLIGLLLFPVACSNKEVKMPPQDYNTALTNANVLRDSALIKMKQKDIKGAIEDYDKALEIFPQGGHLYQNRALAKMDIKDYKGAIEDFKQVKIYYPNLAQDIDNNIKRLTEKMNQQK